MKKVCVVTTTRAEYGYLRTLIDYFVKDKNVEFQMIVSGTHLDKRYGYTIDEIKKDGIKPTACVEIMDNDSQTGVLNTMANAISKIGKALSDLKPDIVILLGDRYETFAIASACVVLNIPIAHISGGDVTYGAYDDMFRHSITKMSNIHFTSCEEYRNRVIQLGEHPERVFNVGSLSLENLRVTNFLSEKEINEQLGINISNTLLTTFHPVTMEKNSQSEQFNEVMKALSEQDKYDVLFTRANADTGSSELNKILDEYIKKYPKKLKVVDSLGIVKYMSAMKYCRAVVGNSSSGILEAPSFKVPTINIGNRQKGRLQAKTVINCEAKKEEILKVINNLPDKESLKNFKNPYEQENTAENIYKNIIKYLKKGNFTKEFYDIV